MNIDYEKLISIENLFESWRAYKKGKSRKADVMEFERHLEDNLFSLHENLKTETYAHGGYSYFRISDPKKRDIWKAMVRDRIVHQSLYAYLCGIYEPLFIASSFSSRKNKGTHKAISALSGAVKDFRKRKKACFAMKCDIRKYFENIDHDILLKILQKNIGDDKIFDLLKIIVESFNKNTGEGIPLGNITSQIFANIYLNELDKFATGGLGVEHYVRYNDDFIILESNREKLFADVEKIRIFLEEMLSLEMPKEKTIFRKFRWGIDFCGCIVLSNAVLLRNKTKGRMLAKIEAVFRRLRVGKISLSDARKVFDSYLGLLSHCRAHNLKSKIRNKRFREYFFGKNQTAESQTGRI